MRLVATVVLLLALALAGPSSASAAQYLPDIDVHAPYGLQRTTDGSGRTFVAFDSFVENVGAGPLKLLGQRASTATPRMAVTQVLLNTPFVTTGTVERAVPAGEMEFSGGGGHNHWHYLRFEDYMLLSVPDLEFVAPTRKTGFCLVGLDLAYSCGGGQPGLTAIGDPAEAAVDSGPFPNTRAMGMIVPGGLDDDANRSSSDHYGPSVEGQDIEITDLADGRYCLSFVVDPEGKLVEASTANNGASRLIDVGTDAGGRTVAVGAGFPDSATCGLTKPVPGPAPAPVSPDPPPPVGDPVVPQPLVDTAPAPGATPRVRRPPPMTRDRAARLAKSALRRRFRNPARVKRRCRPTALDSATCRVSFRRGAKSYRGTVSVKQKPVAGEWRWYYRIRVGRVRTRTQFGGVLGVDAAAARRLVALPAGRPAPFKPGTAWSDAQLCRIPPP